MSERSLEIHVNRLRLMTTEATMVAAELWARRVLDGSGSDADARAADERLSKIAAALAGAEKALEEHRKQEAYKRATVLQLGPEIKAALSLRPIASKAQLARVVRARRELVDLALSELIAWREVVMIRGEGYSLPSDQHAQSLPI